MITIEKARARDLIFPDRPGRCRYRRRSAGPAAVERRVDQPGSGPGRGARSPDGAQVKVFSVYDHAQHLVLTQSAVVDGDEIAAFTTALATLPDLAEVVVTADALHCQREHAAWLAERGGHYLFTVEGNQPTLRRTLAALPWAQVSGSRRRQSAHGRTESRSIKVIDLDGHPAAALFPHATRAIKVVRRRRDQCTGKTSTGRLRNHLADLPPGRPAAAGHLDPGPLGHREPGASRPRRHPG